MKKIFILFVALLSVVLQGKAQQYINIYQDDVIIRQFSTNEIDSISVTETEPRIISLWQSDEVIVTYSAAEVDSIKLTSVGCDPLAYIGIVGFNDDLYVKNIGVLSSSTASQYKTFVNNLPRKDGTLLYYAVDNALDMLDKANIQTPLRSVNFITFTDGLDQGSMMMSDKYGSSSAYLEAMSQRIAETRINDLPINAYSVGLRGNDVSNNTQFSQNLQSLASSSDKAFEVSSIYDLRTKLQDIAKQIISVSTRQSISIKVPGIDNGTQMRFVFDDKSAANSSQYIEGTFNLQDRSLYDVTYHGMKSVSGSFVQGTQNGIFVTYTFTGIRPLSGDGLVPTSSITHYYRLPGSTSWQVNSDFSPAGNTKRSVSHSGTSIVLVLDCSSSLGSDFSRMQQYANDFIDQVAANAEPFELQTPSNFKAAFSEDGVNLTWDAVKYAQNYEIWRCGSAYGSFEKIAENIVLNSWTDESPLEGKNYYRLYAICYGSTSPYASAQVTFELQAPSNFKAAFSEDGVNLTWDAVEYAKNYEIWRSGSGAYGSFVKIAENVVSNSWTDESPLEGENYYRLYAICYG
ncbi:MAG: hypothetical protein IKR91_05785, partial [Alloprevotella sp.]|nr:hypothetical protein [Alloprevotella sp.]